MIVSSLFLLASIMMLILSTVPEFQVPAIYLIMKAKSATTWLMAKYLKDPNTNYQNNGQLPQVPKHPITEHPITQIMISYVEGVCRNENGNAHLSEGSVV